MKIYVFRATIANRSFELAEIHASHLSKKTIRSIKKALQRQHDPVEKINVFEKLTEISYRQVES